MNLSCHKKIKNQILICYIIKLLKCHYIINIPENKNIYQKLVF